MKCKVIEQDLWIKKNDYIHAFRGANDSLGTLVLKFNTEQELKDALINQTSWINIVVK